ncbi:cupin domain-containing protein [Halococcus agarilyticus]|uniref:cupin domain-containing protein n=1 Tax=Halococcus agarilyticus TaxID=1232219 RepID=UPI000677E1DE|nr:cupin domain-containing protein [Halococcus agarilyticus]
MSYSKINTDEARTRTRTESEPGVKTLGYELKAADEPRPNEMRFNYFVYEPGDTVRRHTQVEQEETFFVVEGRGRMVVGDEAFAIEAGDTVVVDPGPWRHIEAEEEMRIFAVGAPNRPDDVIFLEDLADPADLPEGVPEP